MEDKQKESILYMYSRLQGLEKAVHYAHNSSKALLRKQLDDAERRFSSIMNSLPSEDWKEMDALLRKGKRSTIKKKKRDQKNKEYSSG